MKKVALLAALQVGVMLAWAGYHEAVRAHAPTFRIPLRPIDPYDTLRGRYFILNPLDGALDTLGQPTPIGTPALDAFARGETSVHETALVGFCPEGDVHRVCALRRAGDPPSPGPTYWARGFVQAARNENNGWTGTIDLQLDKFFLPDRFVLPGPERDPSWELEVSYRPEQPLLPRRLWFKGQPVDVR